VVTWSFRLMVLESRVLIIKNISIEETNERTHKWTHQPVPEINWAGFYKFM
jgi:hypothetical protein